MTKFGLALAASLALASTAFGSPTSADPPTITPWHAIGAIGLGESKVPVFYRYGDGKFVGNNSSGYEGHAYVVPGGGMMIDGGNLTVVFRHGHVTSVQTTSPRYRTPAGIGVGSSIPLGLCHRVAGACQYRWNGFRFITEGGVGFWLKNLVYNRRKQTASLDVRQGRITTITLQDVPRVSTREPRAQ